MRKPIIPFFVDDVLSALEFAGYEAYAVGGCCRDMILGRTPQDWDLCTSALPEDVMNIFPSSIQTGIKHGTITVRHAEQLVEVTTFRVDGEYYDHRRPESVRFTSSLRTDLSRRDFTMNALAMDRNGEIVDYFDGEADIRSGIIRCVGNAETRFTEDALRMFRAVRFSAQLGFELDAEIVPAIKRLAPLASHISVERIQIETRKALISPRPERLQLGFELGLFDKHLFAGKWPQFTPLHNVPPDLLMRYSALCALLQRSGRIESAEVFLRSLKCDSNTVHAISKVLDPQPIWLPAVDFVHVASKVGRKFALCAAAAMQVLGIDDAVEIMRNLLAEDRCLVTSELEISGTDLIQLGFSGNEIGKCLDILLMQVLQIPEYNYKAKLQELAIKNRDLL